ncbi:hypothetical protein AVEN_83073-1 [Araneus ventricosus]|uniref:Uncharacterized protein n=1 Tax=Araneus ventricosus TaxID=182803 RepID=A0A4Y2AML6_ARAVE|nr:hypothetical protein AVEN_83073-1 [Araneus ventricosus]
MASRTDAPAKCEFRSVICFLQAEGWKTMNAAVSCQTLRRLRRGHSDFWSCLIHDNAHPHSAAVTQQLLEQFKWDVSIVAT